MILLHPPHQGRLRSISYVSPRYGLEVVGGAENAVRQFAERLALRQIEVEVFTTTAKDSATWEHHYPEGDSIINGVSVHRFRPDSGRDPDFLRQIDRTLFSPGAATMEESRRFIDLQGPKCAALNEAVRGANSDLVAFYPYLYDSTVANIRSVAERAIFHPAAHDEPALSLPIFKEVFECVHNYVFHTVAEQELVMTSFDISTSRQIVLGLGIEPNQGKPSRSGHEILGLGSTPYFVCLGRVDGHKGTTMASIFFNNYRARTGSLAKLVFVGQVVVPPDPSDGIILTGEISEDEKWAILASAEALISPSYFEAFSLVLFEAWSVSIPVIVNGSCGATTEHVRRSAGGLSFDSYAHFEVTLDLISSDPDLRRRLGEAGQHYYEKNFQWSAIIDRYLEFLDNALPRSTSGKESPLI